MLKKKFGYGITQRNVSDQVDIAVRLRTLILCWGASTCSGVASSGTSADWCPLLLWLSQQVQAVRFRVRGILKAEKMQAAEYGTIKLISSAAEK